MLVRDFFRILLVLNLTVIGSGCGAQDKVSSQTGTVEPGYLTVAIIGDMPMTAVKNGKLIGTDGDKVADNPSM